MNKLSVILIVRNEEKNIRRCLESVKWADEMILVDQSSTDRTTAIALEYTDKIFVTESKNTSEPDREFAVSKTRNDWVFLIDADEVRAKLTYEVCIPAVRTAMIALSSGARPVVTIARTAITSGVAETAPAMNPRSSRTHSGASRRYAPIRMS